MAGTQGIGTFGINSKFASGSLVFYEKTVGRTATGDVFTVGTTAVKVGGTAQDVDFQFYGTGSISAIIDTGATSFTLTSINTTMKGTLTVGVDDTGHDVKFFGATTGAYLLWDESDDRLELDGADINLQDNDRLQFGDSQDVVTYWDGALYLSPAASNTLLALGTDGQGLDVRFFTNTGSVYVDWDASANRFKFINGTAISMADSTRLWFGTGDDMNLFFDGTTLYFACSTQNINFNLGDSGSGLALKLESNTAGHYVQWTPSTNMLDFVGAVGLGKDGAMGATFDGAVTNITVSRGIVTAAS